MDTCRPKKVQIEIEHLDFGGKRVQIEIEHLDFGGKRVQKIEIEHLNLFWTMTIDVARDGDNGDHPS